MCESDCCPRQFCPKQFCRELLGDYGTIDGLLSTLDGLMGTLDGLLGTVEGSEVVEDAVADRLVLGIADVAGAT